jgi:hypothetical protein
MYKVVASLAAHKEIMSLLEGMLVVCDSTISVVSKEQ